MRLLLVLILFVILSPLYGQGGADVMGSLHYQVHSLDESFYGARVERLLQTDDGWLWLGADDGLIRYDGRSFERFRLPDSLTDNYVSALYSAHDGKLWVGYRDGAIGFLDGHTLQLWRPEEGLPKAAITGFAEDGHGGFWFSTYGEGIYYHSPGGRLFNMNTDDGLPGNDIYVVAADRHGRLWAGTDHGLVICRFDGSRKQVDRLTRQEGLPDDIVRSLKFDTRGGLWIGTYDRGVCRLDTISRRFIPYTPEWKGGVVTSLALLPGKELWIGTEDKGVWRVALRGSGPGKLHQETMFQGARIFDLLFDQEGNNWVASNTPGICSTNRHFEFFGSGPDQIQVQALLVDKRQQLWIGTTQGLYRFEQGRMLSVDKLPEVNVLSLFEDPFGNIWIGTFGDGVLCYHPGSERRRWLTEADGLTNGSVLDIDGLKARIYLATLGGVTEFDCRQDPLTGVLLPHRNFNEESGLGTNFIYTVFVDRQGGVWFGTDGKGVSMLRDGKLRSFQEVNGKALHAVYGIAEDRQGHLWFSTAREGLLEFDGRRFRSLGLDEGLRDPEITTLATDANGDLLVVHNRGIDLIDPVTRQVVSFDKAHGLSNTGSNLNAVASDNEGHTWIGTQGQFLRYTALAPTLRRYTAIHLSRIDVLSEPVATGRPGIFRYNENHFIFKYAGFWFTDPEHLAFRYRLRGYNLDWIASRDPQAIYSSLSPGNYTFEVSATVNGRFDRSPVATYNFTILKPYWQTWWFISIACLSAAITISFWMRQRERRLQRESTLEREKIESQYEMLKSQINPHFLFNSFNTLVTIIEEDPELAVEYVEKLSDFYRNILQYREKELIRLSEELQLVQDYIFLLQKRYGDHLRLHVEGNGNGSYVAPLTLQLLVENAVKHNIISRDHPLEIYIKARTDGYLSVSNNLQEKRTQEPSTGFGLSSIVSRYRLLHDRPVLIEKTRDQFSVSIPLIKKPTTHESPHH